MRVDFFHEEFDDKHEIILVRNRFAWMLNAVSRISHLLEDSSGFSVEWMQQIEATGGRGEFRGPGSIPIKVFLGDQVSDSISINYTTSWSCFKILLWRSEVQLRFWHMWKRWFLQHTWCTIMRFRKFWWMSHHQKSPSHRELKRIWPFRR